MTNEPVLILCIAVAVPVLAKWMGCGFWHEFVVNEGYAGLLYHRGKLVATLSAGRHLRFGRHYRVALVDRRETSCHAAGESRKPSPSDLPPSASLGGVPLRLLLSDRSGPGGLLRDTLTMRPSSHNL